MLVDEAVPYGKLLKTKKNMDGYSQFSDFLMRFFFSFFVFYMARPLLRKAVVNKLPVREEVKQERRNAMERTGPEFYTMYGPGAGERGAEEISEVERLMNEFEAHEGQEAKFVQRYKEIAEKSENPLIKLLLRLIISDEEKHYSITHAMVSTLKGGLTWSRPEDAISGFYDLEEGTDELLKLTEDFIGLEREGIKEYKKLIKASKHYYRGLFGLLLQSMIRDSEKHVEILEFLRQRLKEA